jgi:WD40 repeat protein
MCVMNFTQDKYLITATVHGDMIVWDLDTFEKSEEINIHNGHAINDMKECKTNFRLRSCVVTGSSDGSIKILSLRLEQS